MSKKTWESFSTLLGLVLQKLQACCIIIYMSKYDLWLFSILPAVWVSSGSVAKSKESVVNERQQQASLATVNKEEMTWIIKRTFTMLNCLMHYSIAAIQPFCTSPGYLENAHVKKKFCFCFRLLPEAVANLVTLIYRNSIFMYFYIKKSQTFILLHRS